MTALKDRILGIVKEKGRISESLLLETFEMDEELESIPIEQIKGAISQLLNDCEIEEVGKLIPTDSPTAWIMKTIYTMPDSFYRPEIKWEIGACLSFICPWEGVEKRFEAGKWEDDGFCLDGRKKQKWVESPIHQTVRQGMRVQRMLAPFSWGAWRYSLSASDGEVYELRQVNDQQ
jgi:hypothetical protein